MASIRIIMRRCMGKCEQEQLTLEYCATEKALAGWQALFLVAEAYSFLANRFLKYLRSSGGVFKISIAWAMEIFIVDIRFFMLSALPSALPSLMPAS